MATVIKFHPSGRVVATWDEGFPFEAALGPGALARRRRASLIDTVPAGPRAGHFYADMSHLADLTGDDRHRVCLLATSPCEADVRAAEARYVADEYVRATA